MMRKPLIAAVIALPLLAMSLGATAQKSHPMGGGDVDYQRQLGADSEPGPWMSAGRTYDEQRYSPLTKINASNIQGLGLAWYGEVDTQNGQESTPVVVDGVMYITK